MTRDKDKTELGWRGGYGRRRRYLSPAVIGEFQERERKTNELQRGGNVKTPPLAPGRLAAVSAPHHPSTPAHAASSPDFQHPASLLALAASGCC